MICLCCICQKEFKDKVGMSPMESNLAIRFRNKIGNICPECKNKIAQTQKGRWQIFKWNLKVALYCLGVIAIFVLVFAAFIFVLGMFVL